MISSHRCNEAANLVSVQAFGRRITGKQARQRLAYGDLKQMGLSAQPAIHVARKVSGAYAALKANIQAGNLGEPGSARRAKAESKPIRFRPDAAQPYDDRCLSWQMDRQTVSIWTTAGRMAGISFRCSAAQYARLRDHRQGESDLVHRDGKWYLYATCDIPEPETREPGGFLGVDLGIANIAVTDDGTRHSGEQLNRHRRRCLRLRHKLQAKGTKSAKRLLRKRARREARFAADANHKAAAAGVAVVYIDPAYTSQMCSACGHISKRNRPDQATFCCTSRGFAEHADVNAARNIASRGAVGWAVSHAAERGTLMAVGHAA